MTHPLVFLLSLNLGAETTNTLQPVFALAWHGMHKLLLSLNLRDSQPIDVSLAFKGANGKLFAAFSPRLC